MISTISLVALGGAIGATCRYLAGVGILRLTGPSEFPLAVLSVNILGSFLMGVFVVAAAHRGRPPRDSDDDARPDCAGRRPGAREGARDKGGYDAPR